MNAYKCDICGKYFEDGIHKKGAKYLCEPTDEGHHQIIFRLAKADDSYWPLFDGDMCPDCMGYFCVGLVERGCQSENVKMYAADYIRKAREEMGIKEETT